MAENTATPQAVKSEDPAAAFAERLADYLLTRNTPWADEAVVREAVREAVRLIFGEAIYETRSVLATIEGR